MNGDAAHAISYRYNLLGKVDSIQDPHLGKITYLYSPFGDIIRHTNARNQVTSFNYDILGRPTVSSSPEGVTRWYYDSQPYGIGQLDYSQFVFDNAQYYRLTKSCKYDKMGRLIRSTQDIDGDTASYAFKYNIYGYQKKIVYPSGFVVQTEYDKRGFTSKISNPVYGTLWKLVSQNPFGNVTSSELGEVYSSNKYYNSQTDRLVKIRLMSKSPYKVLYEGKYNWNILGSNFNSRSDIGSFTYGEINAGPQAVTSIQTQNGVFPSTTQSVLQYTSFEKIKEMNEDPWALKVLYDEAGQKLIQSITNTQSQETATTLYQGFSEKVTSNGMVKTTDYIASPEGVIAIFTRNNNTDSTLHYILKDYAGSMIGILNPNGTYAQEMNYDPWGRRRDSATWQAFNNTPPPALYSRGYTMHEHLAHFGLIDMKGRVYDPLVGRFLSPDPFIQAPEFSLSFNRYSYCLNNPLLYTDPTGFFAEGPDIGTSGFYNNLAIDDDLGNVNSGNETGGNTEKQTKSKRNTAEENLNDINDPFILSRIIATIYYDAKHAISEFLLNSNSIMAYSGLKWRVKYKTDENGNEIFGTQITIEPAGSFIEEGVNVLLNGLTLYSFYIGEGVNRLFSETGSNTQFVRIARESVSESAKAAKTGTVAFRSVGAAGKEVFNPANFKAVSQSYLKSIGIEDIHAFRQNGLELTKD